MKKSTKISSIIITLILVLIISMKASYGVEATNTGNSTNSTNSTNNTSGQSSNTSNTTNTTSTNTDVERANNANLSNLGIRPHDFTGFRYGTTNYDVTVPNSVESIEVYASAQASKATVSGTGKKELEVGKNSFPVEVTAEDGTKKTYTINVTREGSEETEERENESETTVTESDEIEVETRIEPEGLAELKINNTTLTPEFKSNVYEYTGKYIGQDESLTIETKTTKENYKVEITGNYDLQEGENLINILVTDTEGETIAVYQLTVDKQLVDREAEARNRMMIIGGSVLGVIILIVIVLIIRHKRNQDYADEYSIPFSRMKDDNEYDEYEDDEEEIEKPKALREEYKKRYLDNYNEEDDLDDDDGNDRKRNRGKRYK